MTRETDSSSSGPQGRGAAAYPSGTPPYGSPHDGAAGADSGAEDGNPAAAPVRPDEPRTETTLTTRVRINIPGSRPIPPVVVRKAMTESERAESAAGRGEPAGAFEPVGGPAASAAVPPAPAGAQGSGGPASAGSASAPSGIASGTGPEREKLPQRPVQGTAGRGGTAPASGPGTGSGPGEKSSDWFAPRKAPQSAPRSEGADPGAPDGPRFVPDVPRGTGPGTGAGFGAGARATAAGPGGEPDPYPGADSAFGGPRPPAPDRNGFAPDGTGRPDPFAHPAPGAGLRPGGTLGDFTPASDPQGAGPSAREDGLRSNSPYASADSAAPRTGSGGRPGDPFSDLAAQAREGLAQGGRTAPPAPGAPAGPTTGPAIGTTPLPPPPSVFQQHPQGGPPSGPSPHGTPPHGVPGVADDTALHTTRPPAPAPGNVSGETLTSGIPVVPGADRTASPFRQGPDLAPRPTGPGGAQGPVPPHTDQAARPPAPGVVHPVPSPAPASAKAKKKGRSKLVVLAAGLVGVGVVAYGVGLLLNHSDVPKGTTAFGVDIGGSTQEEAVQKLDTALGKRVTAPLELTVGGETLPLKPEQAGLGVDTEATVRGAVGSDYNPVSVIGSLFGGKRVAVPEMPVDEEKLGVALTDLTAGSKGAGASDGTIVFRNGKAVPSYGKPYQGIDVGASADAVVEAYQERAETGEDAPVALTVREQRPKVGDAEVDRAMKEFATPALSGWVWLKAGAVEVPFSEKSIGEMLTMKAGTDGSLQPVINLQVLQEKYGSAFDGVTVEGGAGEVAMTPQHAAAALVEALKKPAPAAPEKRYAVVEGASGA